MSSRATDVKRVTIDAVITTANDAGLLWAITLLSGTTDSSIKIRDGGANGDIIWELSLNGTTAAGETSESIAFSKPVVGKTDLYADITGTGAIAYVSYEEIE